MEHYLHAKARDWHPDIMMIRGENCTQAVFSCAVHDQGLDPHGFAIAEGHLREPAENLIFEARLERWIASMDRSLAR